MSKGSATENNLGDLHLQLTNMFAKILKGYNLKLEVVDRLSDKYADDDLLAELLAVNIEPSPAMLSAISKFLKDNEITVDSAELDQLSAQEERLANRQRNRPDLKSIINLKVIENG